MPRWGGSIEQKAKSKSCTNSPNKHRSNDKENDASTMNESKLLNLSDQKEFYLTDDPKLFTLSYIKQLSPQCHEAMRRNGVVPREIIYKPKDWFVARLPQSSNNEIAIIRFNHYQNKRKALIRDLKRTRQQIIASNWMPLPSLTKKRRMSRSATTSKLHTPSKNKKLSSHKSPSKRLSRRTSSTSSLLSSPKTLKSNPAFELLANDERFTHEVLKEETHFEQIVNRQKADMEKMIAYEIKMMLQRNEQHTKMLNQEKYQDQLRKAYNDKMEAMRHKKHKEEEIKRAMQEEKEKNERIAANKAFQQRMREKQIAKRNAHNRKKREDEELKLQQQKQEEFARRTWEKQQKIRQRRLNKLQKMMQEDRERKRKLEQRRKQQAAEKAEKLRKKQERARMAYMNNEEIRNQKAMDLKRKKEEEEAAIERFLNRKRCEQEARRQKADANDAKRRRAKELAENKVKMQAKKIMDKEKALESYRRKMKMKRMEEEKVKNEVKRLKQEEKWQNIRRNKRIQKYRRMSMNKKQEYEHQRLKAIDQFKTSMVQQRKIHSEHSTQQRKQIIKEFSNLLKSDKFADQNLAIQSMLELAETNLGDTEGLIDRLKNDFGIDLQSIEEQKAI